MILIHCPDLQELTIDGTFYGVPTWDTQRLLAGRWSQLRHFSTGTLFPFPEEDDSRVIDISQFKSLQPALESLSLREIITKDGLKYPMVVPSRIHAFKGGLKELSLIHHSSLQHLILTSYLRSIGRDLAVLRSLPSLLSLDIKLLFVMFNILDPPQDEDTFAYHHLSINSPKLRSLKITTNRTITLVSY